MFSWLLALKRKIEGIGEGVKMAYSNFTLEAVRREFQLEIVESAGIFSQVSTIVPQDRFIAELKEKVELAISSGTEKARSELIVTDVLFQLREHFNRRISFFSGIEFSVDAEQGLTGVCDFFSESVADTFFLRGTCYHSC